MTSIYKFCVFTHSEYYCDNLLLVNVYKTCSEFGRKLCDSPFLDETTNSTVEECKQSCDGTEKCEFIFWLNNRDICFLHESCDNIRAILKGTGKGTIFAKYSCPGNFSSTIIHTDQLHHT